jgi:hypothetical protein
MDTILQSILDVAGVSAAMVFDSTGRLVSHRGRAIYDRGLCEQLSGILVKAIDSIQLQQEDWDSISAQYADGKLLLRKLATASGAPHTLAIVADATLNTSFATVAIRVAANKLRKVLDGATASQLGSSTLPSAPPPLPTAAPPAAADSKPGLSSSSVTWSKTSSSINLSRVAAADPAAAAFLSRTAKELARHVGPMAKVYVEEAVRRVSPDAPFPLSAAVKLVEDLASQIEDEDDRAQFRKAIAKG